MGCIPISNHPCRHIASLQLAPFPPLSLLVPTAHYRRLSGGQTRLGRPSGALSRLGSQRAVTLVALGAPELLAARRRRKRLPCPLASWNLVQPVDGRKQAGPRDRLAGWELVHVSCHWMRSDWVQLDRMADWRAAQSVGHWPLGASGASCKWQAQANQLANQSQTFNALQTFN